MLDTSVDAYIAAYRRHEHTTTCAAIVRAIMATARRWDFRDDCQQDYDEEREGGWAYGS
jgi:hypothetical protein